MKALNLPPFVRSIRLNWTFWISIAYTFFAFIIFYFAKKLTDNYLAALLPTAIYLTLSLAGLFASTRLMRNRMQKKVLRLIGNTLFIIFLFFSIALAQKFLDPISNESKSSYFIFLCTCLSLSILGLFVLFFEKKILSALDSIAETWMKIKTDNYSLEGLLRCTGLNENIVMPDKEGKLRRLPTISGLNKIVRGSSSNIYLQLLSAKRQHPLSKILTIKETEAPCFILKSEIASFIFHSACFINGKFLIDTEFWTAGGNREKKMLSIKEIHYKIRKLEAVKKRMFPIMLERIFITT